MIEAVIGLLMFVNGEIKGGTFATESMAMHVYAENVKLKELFLNLLLTNVGVVKQN